MPLLPRHQPFRRFRLTPPARRRRAEGAGAFLVRVGEDADVVELGVVDEGLELGEVLVRLAREADDEGRPQCDAGNALADRASSLS